LSCHDKIKLFYHDSAPVADSTSVHIIADQELFKLNNKVLLSFMLPDDSTKMEKIWLLLGKSQQQ